MTNEEDLLARRLADIESTLSDYEPIIGADQKRISLKLPTEAKDIICLAQDLLLVVEPNERTGETLFPMPDLAGASVQIAIIKSEIAFRAICDAEAKQIKPLDTEIRIPLRSHHLVWDGNEWVDDRCGCRYHPDDANGSHGGAPHVHRCDRHAEARPRIAVRPRSDWGDSTKCLQEIADLLTDERFDMACNYVTNLARMGFPNAVASPPEPPAVAPIPMILTCPSCGARHVDKGEYATKVHHTHACQSCGICWRPAIVPTVGVQFLPGFKDPEP